MLAPGGVLMGVVTVVSFFASRIYMPHALEYAAEKFGDLGVAFTYIGWLFAVAFALIVATVIGVVLAREPGPVSRFLASRASGSGSATAPPEHMSSGTSDAPRAEGVSLSPSSSSQTTRPGREPWSGSRRCDRRRTRSTFRGPLSPGVLARLDGATSQEIGGETVLLTAEIDQESLHQLVARLRDLGIELLEVRQATMADRPASWGQS